MIRTGYEHHLRKHGHRSLLLYPLHVGDQLVGLMELASPKPGDLNAFNARRLVDVVPLFATTLKRNLDELEDHVQAVIKRKYTAIHSSVEWRFRAAALHYLEEKERGEVSPELEQIVFHDVYPLYGLVDMRNSSRIRNEAIRADLSDQLQLALERNQCRRTGSARFPRWKRWDTGWRSISTGSNPNSGRTTNQASWSSSGVTWSRYLDNSRPTGVTWRSVWRPIARHSTRS